MDSKPLIFISTPATMNSRTRSQANFDSREVIVDEKIKQKLDNVIKLNNKGRNIICKIYYEQETFNIIPKEIKDNYLIHNNQKYHLSKIKEVEIMQL